MKRRILSFLCAVAILIGMTVVPAYAAEAAAATNGTQSFSSLQAAVDDYTSGVIVLQEDAQDITVPLNVYLDLNGHDVAGITVTGGTLYIKDSQTDDFAVADGNYGKITDVTGAVAAAEGYLAVTAGDGQSFHCVDLQIKAMSLRPGVAGVYYTSNFSGDEVVAEQVQSFGIALSVAAEPAAENIDSLCGYSVITGFEAGSNAATGTLLTGIMSEDNTAAQNAANAAMPVYGRAYIKTASGYTFGTCVSRDLRTQVEAIDGIWDSLNATQKASILAMYNTYASVMDAWAIPNLSGTSEAPAGDVVVTVPVQSDNGVVTEAVTVEQDGVSITIPFGTLLEAGATELTLNITKKQTSDSGIEAEDGQTLMPFDVHVEGISSENTVPLTVALGKVMPENLNMGNYTVYHVEENGTNPMELVANDEEFTAHNQYKYTLDGELTLHMATFSEVAVVSEDDNGWNGDRNYEWYNTEDEVLYIRNADQLAGFSAIVGGMDGKTQDSFAGKTVKLLSDINLNDAEVSNQSWIFYPIGYYNSEGTYEKDPNATVGVTSGFYSFDGIFDGNGNTISNFYQNTWEMKGDHNWYDAKLQYYRDGMGLFGWVYGGTVKNLTVDRFSSDGEIATTGVIAAYADSKVGQPVVFENIAITNCNPRVYNIGNGGIVGCAGWFARNESDVAGNPITFRNITVDQTNKISALWGTYDVSCGGILGQYYPDNGSGVRFEKCHVAAIIDVNNDVCANYQYYWYRYSGMLMGTVRKNTTKDGYTVADTAGIVAEGCTYTYGSWNEYWYCELVKNSSASYTHDYQFSRLTNIDDITEITNDDGATWLKEGNFALVEEDRKSVECYHIFKDSNGNLYRHYHDKADESNGNDPYEDFDVNEDGVVDTNDLKEDRQRYYLPFGQVLNGLGYGVQPTYEFDGFDLVEDGTVVSSKKFQDKDGADLTYRPGDTIKLSDLVELIVDESMLSESSIYVAASPVDEDGVVSIAYTRYEEAWEDNYFIISEDAKGAIKLVITDYFYCTKTEIILNPEQAAEKFTAKTVADQNAYDQITLGTLFGTVDGATIGNVTATVTDPSGNEKTVSGTSTNWTEQAIKLTKDGEWTVAIKDDDAYCAVTTVTFVVNKVDMFKTLFTNDYLYRVGNASGSTVAWTTIFEQINKDVTLNNVVVDVETVEGDASGDYSNGAIQFSGTGVVEVTISADGTNPESLYLEVVHATNLTSAQGTTSGGSFVLLKDVSTSSYTYYWNATLYGNGFTYSLTGAPTNYSSSHGHGVIMTKNAILDNVVIVGDVYDEYGAYTTNNDYNAAIDIQENTVIRNCYISGCSAPISARGNATIIDTTLYGGAVANLIIKSGTVTLENVTTANYNDGRTLVGMGIVVHSEATDGSKLVLNGTLTQYNFISESDKPDDTYAEKVYTAMFDSSCSQYHFGTEPNRSVNAGIVSMTSTFDISDIEDNANTGYVGQEASLGGADGYVYSQPNTSGAVDNSYDMSNDPHVASVQGAIEPDYDFDYENINYVAKTDGSNDYCYEENGVVKISMDEGDSFAWNTSILTATKFGNTLEYTVTMNGTDYTGTSITFDTAGDYEVDYTYADGNNYYLNDLGEMESYEVTYTKTVLINVSVIKPTTLHAEFTFGSTGTTSKFETINNNTYVMPDVTDTSDTVGSITVSGTTVYYTLVNAYTSDGATEHSSLNSWYMCFPVLKNVITITDYENGGTGNAVTYGSSTTTMPSGLSLAAYSDYFSQSTAPSGTVSFTPGGANTAFKYQASNSASSEPKTLNDVLIYASPTLSNNARDELYLLVQYMYQDNAGATYYYYVGYHMPQTTVKSVSPCVTPDTLVTMADGSQKRIDEVSYGEEIMVWNFYTGEYDVAPVSLLVDHGYTEQDVVELTFSDGTILNFAGIHGAFNADLNEFVDIDASNAQDYVGDTFLKQYGDGFESVELESVRIKTEYNGSITILSAGHHNAILNGMLTISPSLFCENLYEAFEVGEGMKYDEEKMQADIEKYGLYTYEDFAEYVTYEQFVAWNLANMKVVVGKGYATYETIVELLETVAVPNA